MSGVATTTKASVSANVQTRSVVWTANELLRILLEIICLRGLPVDYLHRQHEILGSGFRTWLTGRWLKGVTLEVYDRHTDKLVEKFALEVTYESNVSATEERFATDIDKLKEALSQLKKARSGVRYRVLAGVEEKAPQLPGWTSTNCRDSKHLVRKDLGKIIDTAAIGTTMAIWIEGSDARCTD